MDILKYLLTEQSDLAVLVAVHLSAEDVGNLRLTCKALRVSALPLLPRLRLPLEHASDAERLATLASKMQAWRPWTLHIHGTECAAVETATAFLEQLRIEQRDNVNASALPVLTACTIHFDLRACSSASVIDGMACLLQGVRYSCLRELVLTTPDPVSPVARGIVPDPLQAELKWARLGDAVVSMPEQQIKSINTVRIMGSALPNVILASALSHLPCVSTLSFQWLLLLPRHTVILRTLTLNWKHLTHAEDFSTMLESVETGNGIASVKHVSCRMFHTVDAERVLSIFPAVEFIDGVVSLRTSSFPAGHMLPDCSSLNIHVDSLPVQHRLFKSGGTLPHLRDATIYMALDDGPDTIDGVLMLLRRLFAAAPAMHAFIIYQPSGTAPSVFITVRPVLSYILRNQPPSVKSLSLYVKMSPAEMEKKEAQLDLALQEAGYPDLNFCHRSGDGGVAIALATVRSRCSVTFHSNPMH